jgi:ABC-type nitrate/sulfonate/bicarbonate transport system substrate-binding protein
MADSQDLTDVLESPVTRQELLKRAGILAATAGVWGALAEPALAGRLEELGLHKWTYQMASGWNHEYLGEWASISKGWFRKVGLNVAMVTGSTATTAQEYVATGHGDISLGGGTVSQAQATAAGLKTKIVAAEYNINPRAIISKASNPIKKPSDLYGKTIGVPPDAQADWQQFLKKTGLDATRIHVVPSSFSVGPLISGTWDGMQGLATNQPAAMEAAGVKPNVMLYSNFGIVSVANTLIVASHILSDKRKRADLKKFLHGEILGWRYALKHQDLAVAALVKQYGQAAGLTDKAEQLISRAQHPFMLTPWTRKHGLFTVSAKQMKGNLATVHASGYKVSANALFDLSVLNEIYHENPHLKVFK